MASSEGGVEIEEVNRTNPDAIIREHIDPFMGLHNYQTVRVAQDIDLPAQALACLFQDRPRALYLLHRE